VAEHDAALRAAGAFSAGVPSELGGGGASHADLCAMVRELAHHCSSTALAFSMHTHPRLPGIQDRAGRGPRRLDEPPGRGGRRAPRALAHAHPPIG